MAEEVEAPDGERGSAMVGVLLLPTTCYAPRNR
jgi:hypothetical protein